MTPESDPGLEVAPDGGWRRGGAPWTASAPFYAVLGDPIDHSLSPRLQNAALRARGLPHAYHAVRVSAERLRVLLAPGGGRGLVGFNATAPLKDEVARLCQTLTPLAARAGAVNTVRVSAGRWEGHNTDVGGIGAALAGAWDGALAPAVGVVLGAGGSARAATLALLDWGVGRLVVRGRSPEGRRRFRAWLAATGVGGAGRVAVASLTEAGDPSPRESAVWLVCLAAGVAAAPWLPAATRAAPGLALDLRYGAALPAEPRPPVPWRDGRTVLLQQGGLAFGWWFGEPVPWEAMRAAL